MIHTWPESVELFRKSKQKCQGEISGNQSPFPEGVMTVIAVLGTH